MKSPQWDEKAVRVLSDADRVNPLLAPGSRYTTDSGSAWSTTFRDLAFRTYLESPRFAAAGTLESSVKDAGPWPARWSVLHDVTVCYAEAIFVDGFESGDTSAWSDEWP